MRRKQAHFLIGVAEPRQQVSHAAFGVRDVELLLHPVADLFGGGELLLVQFCLEALELLLGEFGGRASYFPTAEALQSSFFVPVYPIVDAMLTGLEDASSFAVGVALPFEQEAVDPAPQTRVLFGLIALEQLFPLLLAKNNRAFHKQSIHYELNAHLEYKILYK